MKKHDFGAWFLLCGLLFLFTPGVSAMAGRDGAAVRIRSTGRRGASRRIVRRDLHAGARGHRRVRAVCGF